MQKNNMGNVNKLRAQFEEARSEAGTIMRRHRNIRGNYTHGVTGVEQPGDDPSS
jgi:hypothetical protein